MDCGKAGSFTSEHFFATKVTFFKKKLRNLQNWQEVWNVLQNENRIIYSVHFYRTW